MSSAGGMDGAAQGGPDRRRAMGRAEEDRDRFAGHPMAGNCKHGLTGKRRVPSALEPARPGCSGGIESLRRWPCGASTQRNHHAQRDRAQDGGAAVVLKAGGSVNIRGANINNRKQRSNARQGVQRSNPLRAPGQRLIVALKIQQIRNDGTEGSPHAGLIRLRTVTGALGQQVSQSAAENKLRQQIGFPLDLLHAMLGT
jgi:hypothetical protein